MSTDLSAAARPAASSGRRLGDTLAILGAALLWGTSGTAATFAPTGVSPLAIGSTTMGFGGLLLLLLAGKSALAMRHANRTTRRSVLAGSTAILAYPLAFYSSMSLAGVAAGTVVALGSAPIFAAGLEWLAHRQRPSRRQLASAGMSVLGCVVLAVGEPAGPGSGAHRPLLGVLLAILAGASYAGYAYAAARVIAVGRPPRAVFGAMFGLSAVVLVPMAALTSGPLLTTARGFVVAGYLAAVPMCAAYLLFGRGLRSTSAGVATVLTLAEPAVATVLAVLVVGERGTSWSWGGIALIGLGLVVLAAGRRRAGTS